MSGLHEQLGLGAALEQAAEAPPGDRESENAPCRNCGDPRSGRFCPACGQRKREHHLALGTLVRHVVDEAFTINGKLPRTLGVLLFRPGGLTWDYCNGRIARYVRPLRLYLVSSVVFFLLLSILAPPRFGERMTVEFGETPAGEAEAAPDGGATTAAAAPENWTDDLSLRTGNPRIDAALEQKRQRLGRMQPQEAARELLIAFRDRVPTAMFVLLPVFAFALQLLYLRRGRYYVEHFVFALHSHAFVFILFSVMLLLRGTSLNALLALWIPVYLFLAMHRVYGQGLLRTAVKFVLLGFSYVVMLSVTMLGLLVLTLALF